MFPTQTVDNNTIENNEIDQHGRSFLFDFKNGDFVVNDGKVQTVERIEALKVWIEKILRTEKFKFKIYNTESIQQYGISLLELINSGFPLSFIQAEIQRGVTETLLKNTEIKTVEAFQFNRVKRVLYVTFRVVSIYGTIEKELEVII